VGKIWYLFHNLSNQNKLSLMSKRKRNTSEQDDIENESEPIKKKRKTEDQSEPIKKGKVEDESEPIKKGKIEDESEPIKKKEKLEMKKQNGMKKTHFDL